MQPARLQKAFTCALLSLLCALLGFLLLAWMGLDLLTDWYWFPLALTSLWLAALEALAALCYALAHLLSLRHASNAAYDQPT